MGHKGNQINMEREDVDKGKEKDNEAKAEHAKNPYEVSDNELEKTMAKEAREERRKEERRVALRRESDRAALEERESVLRENEQLKDEIKSMKDTMLRRQADFENYKKRAARQQGEIRKMAIRDFAGEIIQINDDLLRAVEASEKLNADAPIENSHRSFVEGVSMISKRIEEALKKFGVSEIDALGQEFDPNFHEAMEIESRPDVERDTVVHVYQKGFRIDDLVVRCAKVKVARPRKDEVASTDVPADGEVTIQ